MLIYLMKFLLELLMLSIHQLSKWKIYLIRLCLLIIIVIFVLNILISIDMKIKLPLIIKEDGRKLEFIVEKFSLVGQEIFRRQVYLVSLFNPWIISNYILSDWNHLLNIPPLIRDCSFISTNLLNGLRNGIIISNDTFPYLEENLIPRDLLSLNKSLKLEVNNLLIIVLTSNQSKSRIDDARRSWIHHLIDHKFQRDICSTKIDFDCLEYFQCCHNISEKPLPKLILIGDQFDYQRGIVTMDELMGKSSYLDAQHRQLKIMIYLFKQCQEKSSKNCLLKNIRWIGLIDDDTWINPKKILHILALFNWKRSIILGHVMRNEDDLLYISGGGGIFLSRSSFNRIVPKFYQTCPFCKYNDLTIGACSAISNISRLHIPLFLPFRSIQLTSTIISNVATIHYINRNDIIFLNHLSIN